LHLILQLVRKAAANQRIPHKDILVRKIDSVQNSNTIIQYSASDDRSVLQD